jgi:hypothetical protein
MGSLLSAIPSGVYNVAARAVGDPVGIAENALEGAVTGGIVGALTSRLYGDKKKAIDKETIRDGAKLGALHGAIGKILSRIPGETYREKQKGTSEAIGYMMPGLADYLDMRAGHRAGSIHKDMAKAESVVRNVYNFNRMKTVVKERMKASARVPKTQHNIKVIK